MTTSCSGVDEAELRAIVDDAAERVSHQFFRPGESVQLAVQTAVDVAALKAGAPALTVTHRGSEYDETDSFTSYYAIRPEGRDADDGPLVCLTLTATAPRSVTSSGKFFNDTVEDGRCPELEAE